MQLTTSYLTENHHEPYRLPAIGFDIFAFILALSKLLAHRRIVRHIKSSAKNGMQVYDSMAMGSALYFIVCVCLLDHYTYKTGAILILAFNLQNACRTCNNYGHGDEKSKYENMSSYLCGATSLSPQTSWFSFTVRI